MIARIKIQPCIAVARVLESGKSPEARYDWVMISISTNRAERLVKTDEHREILRTHGCQDVLTSCFGDYGNSATTAAARRIAKREGKDFCLFGDEHAKEIMAFLRKWHEVEKELVLLVHCEAGVSRSGAVGTFACRFLEMDERAFIKDNPTIYPNELVLAHLMKLSGLRAAYEEFWKQTPSGIYLPKFCE